MKKIILTQLYFRQLNRVGKLTAFYSTLDNLDNPEDTGLFYPVLVVQRRKDQTENYDVILLCDVVFAAKINPSDPGNHYWKIILHNKGEIMAL